MEVNKHLAEEPWFLTTPTNAASQPKQTQAFKNEVKQPRCFIQLLTPIG